MRDIHIHKAESGFGSLLTLQIFFRNFGRASRGTEMKFSSKLHSFSTILSKCYVSSVNISSDSSSVESISTFFMLIVT